MNNSQTTHTLVSHLLEGNARLSDEQHDALISEDRQLYASILRLPTLSSETAMAIIQRLLAVTDTASGIPISQTQRLQEDRLIVEILPHLPVIHVLQGLLKLVERRVNNQRTSGWIRAYILGSPQLEQWAVNYRRLLRKLIRHALGQPVTLTCLHKITHQPRSEKNTAYLKRYLLRYAKNVQLVEEVFLFLFGKLKTSQFSLLNAYLVARQNIDAGKGLSLKVLQGIRGTFHPQIPKHRLRYLAYRNKAKREVTEETEQMDDSLVGLIRRYYRSANVPLSQLNQAIEQEAAHIPDWDAKVYFILDASASMRGFGHRQYNSMAIAMGLLKVFQQRIRHSQVGWIGAKPSDDESFPQPVGPTSLVPALIEAVKQQPAVIILISDGYENVEMGDAAKLWQGFEQLGIQIPLLHIIPAFTERDRIDNRKPVPNCATFLETGNRGFLSTWLRIRAHLQPTLLLTLLRQTLQEQAQS